MASASAIALATAIAIPAVASAPVARAFAEGPLAGLGEARSLEVVAAWILSLLLALACALVR